MNNSDSSFDSLAGVDLGRRTARLMFYALLSVTLMALDYRGRYVDQVRRTASLLAEPIILLVEAPMVLAVGLADQFRDRRALQAERDAFERLLRESQARLLLMQEFERENQQLRDLLGMAITLDVEFLPVELRHIDLNPYSHRVIVNQGRLQGLASGYPVVDASGIVGQIDQVQLHSASVVLISDPDHALPVKSARTGLRTIAYGSGRSDELRLTDLPMNVDLEEGDVLLTSGLGGRFPAGLPVAEVVSVERPSGQAFALATARPAANLASSRHLLVLRDAAVITGPHPASDETPAVPQEGDGP